MVVGVGLLYGLEVVQDLVHQRIDLATQALNDLVDVRARCQW